MSSLFIAAVGIYFAFRVAHAKAFFYYYRICYIFGINVKAFLIAFGCAVYVEVVGFDACNEGDIRSEVMERAVIFVGFGYYESAFVVYDDVAVVVLAYAAEESACAVV